MGESITFRFSLFIEEDGMGVTRNKNGDIVYIGNIEQEKIDKVFALYQPGDRLLITSNGGDLRAGIAFGNFIHQNRMSVEVVGVCISSCANYVFLSGATKILNRNALVVFHGGPKQANFRTLMQQAYSPSAMPGSIFGREGYEAIISTKDATKQDNRQNTKALPACSRNEVLNVYGQCEEFTSEHRLQYLIYLEDTLYSSISPAMDRNIPYHGQRKEYEKTYQAYEYFGFYYDLESLEKLNVENVSVKGGKWHPQSNPLFSKVYKVTIK